ncbi:MAG: hypothetical protein D3908_13090 [Candidatus Electrothrix sp. AUS4]|nr:hypothetical protein [Candidatus Electrothrix sp. AUS4]
MTQMPDQNNIQRDIENLQKQRELVSKKLHDVEMQRITETRAEEKIRLKQVIQEARAERDALDQELARLADNLQLPGQIIFGVPNLPPNYLPRPEYLEEFRAALQQESIGLTGAAHVGVQGMGGLGKSVPGP